MSAPFPLSPAPSWFANCSFPVRNGVFYVGGTAPSVTLSKSGATAYSVRDYYGNVISTGAVSGAAVTPTAPTGGWAPGWYRVYFTGPNTDAEFGSSYAGTSFAVLRSDARFPTVSAGDPAGNDVSNDIPLKSLIGSMSRIQVQQSTSPTLTGVAADVASAKALWFGPTWADPIRPREQWVAFPNGIDAAGATATVQALYPDVQWYEGPSNEPDITSAGTVTALQTFYNAVKAGNPSAKVMGPCPVNIGAASFDTFLALGGGNYCDGFSFHDYNSMTNGNLALGRSSIDAFLAVLTKYGMQNRPLWQTEAGATFTAVYGVHHPRRSRVKMLHTLFWEQYGVPAERNVSWYDQSHGFWSYPNWIVNGDGSLNPLAVLHRVYAEETYGQTYLSRLQFGTFGDAVLLGNLYAGPSGRTLALCAASHMDAMTATIGTSATGSLTVVDPFGNTSTVAVANGRFTVPVGDVPTYVRLPAGATATAYSINDWPPLGVGGQGTSYAPSANVTGSSTVNPSAVNDNAWMLSYGSGQGTYTGAYTMPDAVTLQWPTAVRADRVIIWCAMSWQAGSSLVDFDVQGSNDDVTWTTLATVTRPTPSSFVHGTSSTNVGCQRETYWDEQWIFDVPFAAPVTAKYLRVYVRATSYGGEPDAACVTTGGQGDGQQRIVIQEIAVLCDDNTKPQIPIR